MTMPPDPFEVNQDPNQGLPMKDSPPPVWAILLVLVFLAAIGAPFVIQLWKWALGL